MLSTLCIVYRTSYLYLYRLSSSYADLPKTLYRSSKQIHSIKQALLCWHDSAAIWGGNCVCVHSTRYLLKVLCPVHVANVSVNYQLYQWSFRIHSKILLLNNIFLETTPNWHSRLVIWVGNHIGFIRYWLSWIISPQVISRRCNAINIWIPLLARLKHPLNECVDHALNASDATCI